jgi:hypothetical protein
MKRKADVNWMLVSMIIAVIALAIISFIFWKYSTQASNQTISIASCEARGGKCTDYPTPGCSTDYLSLGRYSCPANQVCCIPPQTGSSSNP